MKRVVILTGGEARHSYFRLRLSNDNRFEVVQTFCEGTEKSLQAKIFTRDNSSFLEKQHVLARKQSEEDFFNEASNLLKDISEKV